MLNCWGRSFRLAIGLCLALAISISSPVPVRAQGADGVSLGPAAVRELRRQLAAVEIQRNQARNRARTASLRAESVQADLGRVAEILRLPVRTPADGILAELDRWASSDAENRAELARLKDILSQVESGVIRDAAQYHLSQAQAAFDDGRLEDADTALAELEQVRRSAEMQAGQYWVDAVLLRSTLAEQRLDPDFARQLVRDARAAHRAQADRVQWQYVMREADSFSSQGELQGNNAHLRAAIDLYRSEALPLVNPEARPLDWAETQNEIGVALWLVGFRNDDIEALRQSIAAYGEAIAAYQRAGAVYDAAAIETNLGNTFSALGQATRNRDYLIEAERHHRSALLVRTRSSFPRDWAVTTNNLGNTLARRADLEADPAEARQTYDLAVAEFVSVLDIIGRDDAQFWAKVQSNIGRALRNKGQISRDLQTLQDSRMAFERALEVDQSETGLPAWLESQSGLAQTELLLDALDPGKGWAEAAVQSFRAVLAQPSVDGREMAQAQMLHQLGLALISIGDTSGEPDKFEEASQVLDAALAIRTPNRDPIAWAESLTYRYLVEAVITQSSSQPPVIDLAKLSLAESIAAIQAPHLLRTIAQVRAMTAPQERPSPAPLP